MGLDWHPKAIQQELSGGGEYVGGGTPKNLWHTTEGHSYPGPHIYVHPKGTTEPTFTLDFKQGKLYQHMPISRAAKSLEHPGGTGQTNNDNVVQTELVGVAAESGQWNRGDYAQIADLGRWIETNHDVARKAKSPWASPRFAWAQWHKFSGHCGHMHAPNQPGGHGDPGVGFRIDLVLGGSPKLLRWRAELARRRRQLVASKHPGQRHFLIRRIGELKRAIVRERGKS